MWLELRSKNHFFFFNNSFAKRNGLQETAGLVSTPYKRDGFTKGLSES